MTKTSRNIATELEDLENQVLKARKLVHESELKVQAIETSIHEIEKFYPKIKILESPSSLQLAPESGFSRFAETALIKA